MSKSAKNRVLDHLDQFYLGWFSPAHFDQKVEHFYFECLEESFLFIIQPPKSLNIQWVLLLEPAFVEDDLIWQFSENIKTTFEKESITRAAVFAFRTRQVKTAQELPSVFQETLQTVIQHRELSLQSEKNKMHQLAFFRPSENQDKVNIETIEADSSASKPLPSFLLDQLHEMELIQHSKANTLKQLPAQFGISLEKSKVQINGSHTIRLNPVIIPIERAKQVKPLPFTLNQWNRFDVSGIPEFLTPLLRQVLDDQQNKHSLRVQKDQLSHLLRPTLVSYILQNEIPLFLKDGQRIKTVQLETIRSAQLEFSPSDNGLDLRPQLILDIGSNKKAKITSPIFSLAVEEQNQIFFLWESMDSICLIQLPQELSWFTIGQFIRQTPWLPTSALSTVVKRLKGLQISKLKIQTQVIPRHRVQVQPIPVIRYHETLEGDVYFQLSFDYQTPFNKFLKKTKLNGEIKVKNHEQFEKTCREFVISQLPFKFLQKPYRKAGINFEFKIYREEFDAWLLHGAEDLLDRGYEIFNLKLAKKHAKSKLVRIKVDSHQQGQWLKLQIQLEGAKNNQNLKNLDIARGFIQDERGELLKIHPEDLKQLQKLLILGEQPEEWQVPVESPQILMNLLGEGSIGRKTLRLIRKTQERMSEIQKFGPIEISIKQARMLRPYQLDGVHWISRNYRGALNSCLADEMGLGKTCQSVVFLDWCHKKSDRPHLVVAPLSALSNWLNEIKQFAPSLKVHLYHGNQRHYQREKFQSCNVIITSYGTLLSDEQWMQKQQFHCLVLDESQTVKNSGTRTARALKKMNSKFRLALSGTPLENNTLELQALVDFLNPGYLGTKAWFRRRFTKPVERGQVEETRDLLKQLVEPMILRRTKDQVALELPSKTESVVNLKMDDDQTQAYRETAKFYHKRVMSQINDTGLERSGVYVLEGMLRLRQVCLEPQLANPEFDGISSVKINYLQELLPELIAQDKRILLFSQFTSMLDKLAWMLDGLQLDYERLQGQHDLKQRQRAIDSFQTNCHLFLISLKAGGTALNLTAADYVILLDPWWNPAAEAQAIDRAHRIGQNKPVMVYRLICENTIEEKILELQDKKRELFESVLGSQNGPLRQLSMQEVLDLFCD